MAEVIHSTSFEGDGPYLIARADLEKLDVLIEQEWTKLRAEEATVAAREADAIQQRRARGREADIAAVRAQAEAEVEELFAIRRSRSISVLLPHERRVAVESFQAAHRLAELAAEEPVGFDIQMSTKQCQCSLSLGPSGMRIRVSPKRSRQAESCSRY